MSQNEPYNWCTKNNDSWMITSWSNRKIVTTRGSVSSLLTTYYSCRQSEDEYDVVQTIFT